MLKLKVKLPRNPLSCFPGFHSRTLLYNFSYLKLKSTQYLGLNTLNLTKDEKKELPTTIKSSTEKNEKQSQPNNRKESKFSVVEDEESMRLDRFLRKRIDPHLPQSFIEKMIRKGKITCISKKGKENNLTSKYRVIFGDVIAVNGNVKSETEIRKEEKLNDEEIKKIGSLVLYKDKHILAINKPSGLACQGGSGVKDDVTRYLSGLQFDFPEKPRLVHRIDMDTSGILLLGRTRQSTLELQKLFKENKIYKTYLAFLSGKPKPSDGIIKTYLKKITLKGVERIVIQKSSEEGAKYTETEYKSLLLSKQGSLVALFPKTGRTHQLRVISASILKVPIIGDSKYEYKSIDGEVESRKKSWEGKSPKLHLHAYQMEFLHPITKGLKVNIICPLPDHMKETLRLCGWKESDINVPSYYQFLKKIEKRKEYFDKQEKRRKSLKVRSRKELLKFQEKKSSLKRKDLRRKFKLKKGMEKLRKKIERDKKQLKKKEEI